MLRKIRITLAILFFGLITFYFLDFAGVLPERFCVLARMQFVPALISLSLATVFIIIALTLLLGRVYCSVVCPMGVFQDVMNWLSCKLYKVFTKGRRRRRFRFSPAKNVLRWTVLVVTLAGFAAGFTFLLGLLEPYSAFGRIVTNVFKPLYMMGNNLLESVFSRFGNYTFYRVDASFSEGLVFVIALVTFHLIMILALKYGRAWCNTVCPVGTVLGVLGKYSLFKVRIDKDKCTHCLACGTRCKASCIDSKNQKIDYSRCVDCFDCLDSCKKGALAYSLPSRKASPADTKDDSRRRFLAVWLMATASVGKLMAKAPQTVSKNNSNTPYKRLQAITPPGSVSLEHFRSSCTSCHLCISKCPSHVLKPAIMEYGFAGVMQPTVYFEKGFCNYNCTVCGDVCPNGAIKPLTVEQKHRTQMGKVVFIEENCIVHLDGTSCGACSEHCPTQAIAMIPYEGGLTIPHVDTDICVGCGGCEYICPARPFRAVHIEGNPVHLESKPFEEEEREEENISIDDFGF